MKRLRGKQMKEDCLFLDVPCVLFWRRLIIDWHSPERTENGRYPAALMAQGEGG